jgi:hypothetical protein
MDKVDTQSELARTNGGGRRAQSSVLAVIAGREPPLVSCVEIGAFNHHNYHDARYVGTVFHTRDAL